MFHNVLALHIIFIVTWFAGLFYMPRLFIYHIEANDKPDIEKQILQKQFKIMEKRLWYGITWPSMIITLILGPWLMLMNFTHYISQPYFILKLFFVAGLLFYHLRTHVIFLQLQNDVIKHSSMKMRVWNEIATVFLVAIVFLIVLKSNTDFVWALLGFIVFSAAIFLAVYLYKRSRKGEENKNAPN
jgi:putative membrane protein